MAAGQGFKTFTTGEVLTAADVNGYLMQGINVFASSAARAAAITSPQEGQYSFLKDTNALEYYDGAAWVGAPVGDITAVTAGKGLTGGGSSGDVTVSLATTAKGDLVAGSGASTAAVLTVGNNGETLVADSSTSTGLRYQANFAAGKNKIINGDLTINQRNFTSSTSGYNFDRFYNEASGGTHTITPQVFTPGAAPVAGYEATNFMRSVVSGQTTSGQYAAVAQKIEDVRTLAGQTITVSFWAKASTGTPKVSVEMQQVFGSGGSGAVFTSALAASTLSTSWARYTSTITIPSISGKTIGTGSSLVMFIWVSAGSSFDARANAIGLQNATLDFWGFQIEAGSVATAFQTATGTLQGELSACQRYLPAISGLNNSFQGMATSTTQVYAPVIFAVTPRVAPTGITVSAVGHFILINGSATAGTGVSTVAFDSAGTTSATIGATITAGNPTIAANQPAFIRSNNASALILFTGCEL